MGPLLQTVCFRVTSSSTVIYAWTNVENMRRRKNSRYQPFRSRIVNLPDTDRNGEILGDMSVILNASRRETIDNSKVDRNGVKSDAVSRCPVSPIT